MLAGNSWSNVSTMSPDLSGSARATTLSPVVVFGIKAISDSSALISRLAIHRASVRMVLIRSIGHIAGRARSRLHAASAATLRDGSGPTLALLRKMPPSLSAANSVGRGLARASVAACHVSRDPKLPHSADGKPGPGSGGPDPNRPRGQSANPVHCGGIATMAAPICGVAAPDPHDRHARIRDRLSLLGTKAIFLWHCAFARHSAVS